MIEAVISFFAEVAVKSTLLLALAAVAAWIARKGPAAMRHGIWCSAMAGVAVLPLVMLVAPRLSVPVLPTMPVAMTEAFPTDPSGPTGRSEVADGHALTAPAEPQAEFPWELSLVALYVTGAACSALGFALSVRRLRRVAHLCGPAAAREGAGA